MGFNTFLKSAMGILVVMVVFTAVLVPVIASAGSTISTEYTNTGAPFAAPDEDTHTISFSGTTISVDGNEYNRSVFPQMDSYADAVPILYSDDGGIFLDVGTAQTSYNVYGRGTYDDLNGGGNRTTIEITNDTAVMTSENGSMTFENVKYFIDPAGDYVYSKTPTVSSDIVAYAGGSILMTGTYYRAEALISGTIDGFNILCTENTDAALSDLSVTDLGDGAYTLNSISYSGKVGSANVSTVFDTFVVPATVVISTSGGDPLINTLLGILPVLFIVGVLVATVGLFASNRRA